MPSVRITGNTGLPLPYAVQVWGSSTGTIDRPLDLDCLVKSNIVLEWWTPRRDRAASAATDQSPGMRMISEAMRVGLFVGPT